MTTDRTKVDPPTLVLGVCKRRGCGNRVVVAIQKGVPRRVYAEEKFCSSICAKQFHGVVQPSDPKPKEAK